MSKLHDSMSADVWAKEFMRLRNLKDNAIDEDLMRTWFANSLMTGWDHAHWLLYEQVTKLKALLLLTDPAVSHIQMNDTSALQFAEYDKWYNNLASTNFGNIIK